MREKGQSLALLYPYSIPLYRKYGWEIISNKISYIIKDRQIPSKSKAPGSVHRVSWKNEDFMKLHTQFAKQTHGCLFRNALAWEEYWRWDYDDTVVAIYYSVENKPLFPRRPNAIETFPAAMLEIIIGTANGFTLFGPFLSNVLVVVSII